jgi:hypothetical protein
MYLKKVLETPGVVEYVAVTADFSPSNEWNNVARITIDKAQKAYEFYPINEWESELLVPPHLYALPEDELLATFKKDYPKHGGGAWTSRIHSWVTEMINRNEFPESR